MQRREAMGLPPGDTDPFYDEDRTHTKHVGEEDAEVRPSVPIKCCCLLECFGGQVLTEPRLWTLNGVRRYTLSCTCWRGGT